MLISTGEGITIFILKGGISAVELRTASVLFISISYTDHSPVVSTSSFLHAIRSFITFL